MGLLKTYSISGDVTGQSVLIGKLHIEIIDSGHVADFEGLGVEGDILKIYGNSFVSESSLDSLISNHEAVSFDDYKENKNNEIDKRTGELIGQGASFDGAVFSLSSNARWVWIGLKLSENEHTFPVKISTIDSQRYEITDLSHLDNFWLTVMGTVKTHYTSGGDLRDLVNLAIDKAGVDAVVDNR
jgi:hypothetical protein